MVLILCSIISLIYENYKNAYRADGRKYNGEYLNGIKEGQGVFTWPNGDRCEGTFTNDKLNGNGTKIL